MRRVFWDFEIETDRSISFKIPDLILIMRGKKNLARKRLKKTKATNTQEYSKQTKIKKNSRKEHLGRKTRNKFLDCLSVKTINPRLKLVKWGDKKLWGRLYVTRKEVEGQPSGIEEDVIASIQGLEEREFKNG